MYQNVDTHMCQVGSDLDLNLLCNHVGNKEHFNIREDCVSGTVSRVEAFLSQIGFINKPLFNKNIISISKRHA